MARQKMRQTEKLEILRKDNINPLLGQSSALTKGEKNERSVWK